ncbi:30S ribosomal protein S16 [Edaphocola flava]|jgi:small subunit ribosomal protein S16|uniref:30S ribosomal protein S16 n=1 Tax=Edaphocola flava TaxID=2499629 RepID=UPI00100B5E6A|nr:30S ribosomal protein S16 [Edaphocola flava]
MAVKIRLQRHGSKKRPFYFIVAANSTSPRDGKFIEKLGTYNPLTVPATIRINRESALEWLNKGAQPTNTVRRILSFKGVLYMKHLMRGVALGLFDETAAKDKFEKWNAEHEVLVANREEAHRKHKSDKRHATTQESVRRVEEKEAAKAQAKVQAEAEATATEEAPTEAPAAEGETPAAE